MLLPLKAICDRKKTRRDGSSLIYIQYCYSSENRTLLNTEIAIPPSCWNKKKQCILDNLPKEYGEVAYLNSELKRILRLIEDLIALAKQKKITNLGSFVKGAFTPHLEIANLEKDGETVKAAAEVNYLKVDLDIYHQIEEYAKSKEKKVAKETINIYGQMKTQLKAFEAFRGEPVTFHSFDYNFYEAFIDFLSFEYVQPRRKEVLIGLKVNTIGKIIKQLRIFIKDRIRRKIIPPIDLTDFKIPEEETDAIYLTYEEINQLYQTDLSRFPHLIEYRDLFVLACLTGLKFSDFSTLRPEDLRRDMLYKKQGKSDHWVVIPLRKEAKAIFTEQFKEKIPLLTNAEFNRHIKTVGKLAGIKEVIKFYHKKGNKDIVEAKPKYEWITTHTARRSFCTNEFLAGTPVKLIMKISGHKSEKDFYKYIRITPEEAAQKIKELWMERDSMEVLTTKLKNLS